MSSSYELYNRIIGTLQPLVTVTNRKQLTNWIWIVVGILQAESIALSKIALHIPVGSAQEKSRITTIRRWLKNPKIDVWSFYEPLLQHILTGWDTVEAVVILDGVLVFGDRLQIFRLSLRLGNRAIPLAWTVLTGPGLTQAEKLEAMFRGVATLLQPRVKRVRLLADAGFRDWDWAELSVKMGWHYDIRLAVSTVGWFPATHVRCRMDELGVKPGQRRYFQEVALTLTAQWTANLSLTWSEGDARHAPELIVVMSDQIACRQRLTEYGWRMSIEESFRDDKSGGFDMAHTQLQHPARLERLLLAEAVAILWCYELGEEVLARGEPLRREIDAGWKRELSLFQLGWRWLQRCVSTAIQRLPRFRAVLKPIRLVPVIRVSNC